jgi:glutamate synthase (NADPH/NADH) large chain
VHSHASVTRRQQVFGYTHEELKMIVAPMANRRREPIGSMGSDTPLAVLSDRPRLLFDYFIQLFAQVTNPPLDAIREELVTSLRASFGPEANLLSNRGPNPATRSSSVTRSSIPTSWPSWSGSTATAASRPTTPTSSAASTACWAGPRNCERRLEEICAEVSAAIDRGCRTIILSDRHSNIDMAPIPSLLLTAAVHHHLVREKTRTQVGLIVEAGDVREVHHVALLIGYGAAAVNPYLVFESAEDLARRANVRHRRSREGRQERPQGARQGRAQGDVQDGRLHDRLLHRAPRSTRRSDSPRRWWRSTSPARRAGSRASGWTRSPVRSRPGTTSATRSTGAPCRTAP